MFSYKINEISKKFFENLNFIFVLIYIVSLEISQITFFHNLAYSNAVNLFLGIAAIILLFRDFFKKDYNFKILKSNYTWILFAFFAVCIISIFINAKYGIKRNILAMFGIFSNFYFIYNLAYGRTKEEINKYIKILFNTVSDIWFIFVLIAFYMYIFKIEFFAQIGEESFAQGFLEQRLFGLFLNVNVAGVISVIVIIFKIFTFKSIKNRVYRIFNAINIVFEYFYMILSGSRTAYCGMLLANVFVVYFFIRKYFIQKKLFNKKFFIESISILICFSSFGLNIIFYHGVGNVLSYVPGLVDILNFNDDGDGKTSGVFSKGNSKKNFKHVDLAREDYKENDDVSNNRFKIWKSAYEIIKINPIFGISPKNLSSYIKNDLPNCYLAKSKYRNVHNGFIELFLFTGVIGGIIMCIFLILCSINILKFLFDESMFESSSYNFVLMFSGCFLMLSFASAVTASFCFDRVLFAPLFWLILGISMYYIKVGRNPKKE